MKLITADYIYTPQGFKENYAIAFDETIIAVDSLKLIMEQFPDATLHYGGEFSILYPGFINTHVHLEFSANTTSLQYGNFMEWLDCVIEKRNDLLGQCDNQLMENKINEMLSSGITTFGAISSFGAELEVCATSPQRVVFFNELIGSNPAYVDTLYGDFLERLKSSQNRKPHEKITPAIAIHSPYSVHPIVLKKAIGLAKEHRLLLSAHFLESQAEREWLESGSGDFKPFFEKFFKTSSPVTTINEFLGAFENHQTHFTHCVQATQNELQYLSHHGHSIAHCPRSNRLLGCGRLEIERVERLEIPFCIATDGLSSNYSLSLFDEMRATLMIHDTQPLQSLATSLIQSVTSTAADVFGLNIGKIEAGKEADFVMIRLPNAPISLSDIPLQTILHTKKVCEVYIGGQKIIASPTF